MRYIWTKQSCQSQQPLGQSATLLNSFKFCLTHHDFCSYSTLRWISKPVVQNKIFQQAGILFWNSDIPKYIHRPGRYSWTYSFVSLEHFLPDTILQNIFSKVRVNSCVIHRSTHCLFPLCLREKRGKKKKKKLQTVIFCSHFHTKMVPLLQTQDKGNACLQELTLRGHISDTIIPHWWWWLIYRMSS